MLRNILIFDTETTGLPLDDSASWESLSGDNKNQYNRNGYPRIAQLSWLLINENGQHLSDGDYYICPDLWVMPEETSQFNGIWQKDLLKKGKPLIEVLQMFRDDVVNADYICGHNLEYDINALEGEFSRAEDDHLSSMLTKPVLDTMKTTVEFCAIPYPADKPRKYDTGCDYKYPKLSELYHKLFGKDFEGAHNSANDVSATAECLVELIKRGIIVLV